MRNMLALHSNAQCVRCALIRPGGDVKNLLFCEHEIDGVVLCMHAAPFDEGVDSLSTLFTLPLPLPFGEHLMKEPVMYRLKDGAALTIARLNALLLSLVESDRMVTASEPIILDMDDSSTERDTGLCESDIESDQDDMNTEYEDALKAEDEDAESEDDEDVSDDDEELSGPEGLA